MSKVMTRDAFIKKLKEIAILPTTYYSVAGGDWAEWNGKSWNFDCVILIKAILWGWNGSRTSSHGGAKYGSNGVYDDNADNILKRCSNVSTDFSKIESGELLWMDGHVGIYIGNGDVIECTAAWEGKVLYSKIDSSGRRSRNGRQVYSWKKHGKLNYIDYSETEEKPTATLKYKVGDTVTINGVYVSSTSDKKYKPAKTKGKITKIIEGARNPYLLENGDIGWTNDACIVTNVSSKVYKTVSNCTWLNLRTSPMYGSNIYKAVKVGTKVEYLGVINGWARIKYENKTLYCGKNYLK